MPTLVPTKRPPAKVARKPRAWRATKSGQAWDWKRIAIVGGAILAAVAIGAGVLYAGSAGPQPTPKPAATPFVGRQIVSSTLSGNTPVSTPTPLAVTPPAPVGATQLSSSPGPAFSAGPPAQVQQVTPVRPPSNPPAATPSGAPAASGTAASSLPGSLVSALGAPRTTPTVTAASLDSSISNDLYAINARATSLARAASALSTSQTPQPSGTPRPAPTDTPIPTAAPPIPPRA